MKGLAGLFFVAAIFFLPGTLSAEELPDLGNKNPQVGRALHASILKKHPSLDSFYKEPFVEGSITPNPVCLIAVPSSDWGSLSNQQKQQLFDYAQSLIAVVKQNPDKYSRVASNAPLAPRARRNISNMTNVSWGISVGVFTKDGRDLLMDKIINSLD